MKLGFFSDVHGNLEALEAVLADCAAEKLEKLFFLGDAVGYGPSPNECVRLVAEAAEVSLMGNHDYAALGLLELDLFNHYAKQTLDWTRRVLDERAQEILSGFQLDHRVADCYLVHASPHEPLNWDYVLTLEDAEHCFPFFREPACLIGHTHRPALVKKTGAQPCTLLADTGVKIEGGSRYLINIGSVGQPRDGNPKASYLVYDTERHQATLKRVAYDFQKVQQKMAEFQVPTFLIERIATGR